MIVDTRPDPTVLPPSRYLNSIFMVFSMLSIAKNGIKSLFLCSLFLFTRFIGTVLAPKFEFLFITQTQQFVTFT